MSKTAKRNAKRKEKRQEKAPSTPDEIAAAMAKASLTPAASASTATSATAASSEPAASPADPAKRLKAIMKKLRQIDELVAAYVQMTKYQQPTGTFLSLTFFPFYSSEDGTITLNDDQQSKISKRAELEAERASLET